MASIVEKETGKAEERPRVAGVFINRLRKHMRLQSDPTIVYGLVGGQGPLGRPLTRSRHRYRQRPTTPMSSTACRPAPSPIPAAPPSKRSPIPSHTQELYFVADGTGGHVFSESLDSHNRNVQRWRQIEQSLKNKPAPGAASGRGSRHASQTAAPSHDDHTQNIVAVAVTATRRWRRNFRPGGTPLGAPKPRLARDPGGDRPPCPATARRAAAAAAAWPICAASRRRALVQFADAFDESQLGGATRAENDLDGPASDVEVNPASDPARVMAANALDGPAEPVESGAVGSARGYAGGVVNPAPNGKPRILDASEGTALDPLLNKMLGSEQPQNGRHCPPPRSSGRGAQN